MHEKSLTNIIRRLLPDDVGIKSAKMVVYKQSCGDVEASERGLRLSPTILQKNRIC